VRGVVNLLRKEWRDVRALTWACMALVPAVTAFVRWVLAEVRQDVWATSPAALSWNVFVSGAPRWWEPLVPGMIALYGALVAADAVGAEVASRRSDGLALLPVGRWRVWFAKITLLCAATALFAAWAVLVQAATLWTVDGIEAAAPFLATAGRHAWLALPIATFVGATLLVSTLRLRGIGAALVGGGLAAGLWSGANAFTSFLGRSPEPWERSAWDPQTAPEEWLIAWLPVVAVLAAAALAYSYGRVHLGRVLRPLGIAAATLVVVVVAPSALMAQAAFSVVPGDPGVELGDAWPSPDGRYVAMTYVNVAAGPQPRKTFVLDVERAVLVEPDCGNLTVQPRLLSWDGVWQADGTLLLARGWNAIDTVHVDPATGAARRSETLDDRASWSFHSERNRDYAVSARDRWYVLSHGRDDDGTSICRLRSAKSAAIVTVRTSVQAVSLQRSPGGATAWVAYFPEPCVLALRKLPDGEERRLLTSSTPWKTNDVGALRADERALLVRHDGAWKVVDVESGATTELPREAQHVGWFPLYGDAARALVYHVGASDDPVLHLLDLDTGAQRDLLRTEFGTARALADGRLVLFGREHGTLDLLDRDLTTLRRLWPREEVRR
jgi:ABC-type transport system involved in multi-copper enzyme maturation permease subunit